VSFGALSVKGRALRYLAQREHSRLELEQKLVRRVQDTPEASAAVQIARALDELSADGLISAERVAESVLTSRAPRFGVHRLRQTLQAKGLDPELVAATLHTARATELQRARDLWQRRYGTPAADAADRARQMRFLAGRGFEGAVIRAVVQGGGEPDDPA
jgi:regulatory protein